MPTPDLPDSIDLAQLQKLHAEKAQGFNFEKPQISDKNIGDLCFLIQAFISEAVGATCVHHQVFLCDILVTRLRESVEAELERLSRDPAPNVKTIRQFEAMRGRLKISEEMLDCLVELVMRKGGMRDTRPSYQLLRSVGVDIQPHEVDDWLRNFAASRNS